MRTLSTSLNTKSSRPHYLYNLLITSTWLHHRSLYSKMCRPCCCSQDRNFTFLDKRNKKLLSWRLNVRLNNFRNKWTQFDLTDQPLLALSSCSTYSNQPWPPVISPLRRQHVNVNLVLRPQSLLAAEYESTTQHYISELVLQCDTTNIQADGNSTTHTLMTKCNYTHHTV